jgi:hypothetical protein
MRAKDRVLQKLPLAIAEKEVGKFAGGTVRYVIKAEPTARKIQGYGQRESWAWAEAARKLGLI